MKPIHLLIFKASECSFLISSGEVFEIQFLNFKFNWIWIKRLTFT